MHDNNKNNFSNHNSHYSHSNNSINNSYLEILDPYHTLNQKTLIKEKSDELRKAISSKLCLLFIYIFLFYFFWKYTYSSFNSYSREKCELLYINSKSLCNCYGIVISIALINLLAIILNYYHKHDSYVLIEKLTSYVGFGFEFIISIIFLFKFSYSIDNDNENCQNLRFVVFIWLCIHYCILCMIFTILLCYYVQGNYNFRFV